MSSILVLNIMRSGVDACRFLKVNLKTMYKLFAAMALAVPLLLANTSQAASEEADNLAHQIFKNIPVYKKHDGIEYENNIFIEGCKINGSTHNNNRSNDRFSDQATTFNVKDIHLSSDVIYSIKLGYSGFRKNHITIFLYEDLISYSYTQRRSYEDNVYEDDDKNWFKIYFGTDEALAKETFLDLRKLLSMCE